jgi:hypothetical protein
MKWFLVFIFAFNSSILFAQNPNIMGNYSCPNDKKIAITQTLHSGFTEYTLSHSDYSDLGSILPINLDHSSEDDPANWSLYFPIQDDASIRFALSVECLDFYCSQLKCTKGEVSSGEFLEENFEVCEKSSEIAVDLEKSILSPYLPGSLKRKRPFLQEKDTRPTANKYQKSDERPFSCTAEGCNKSFKSISNLNGHRRYAHSEERPFPCTAQGCNKSFKSISNLNNHLKSTHSEERPFPCTVQGCNKSFKSISNLNNHLKSAHSEERPFPCTVQGCEATFKSISNLNNHLKSAHSEERPFPCTVQGCEATFKSRSHLNAHRRYTHSEERPFPCTIQGCKAKFKTQSKLNTHLRNVVHKD